MRSISRNGRPAPVIPAPAVINGWWGSVSCVIVAVQRAGLRRVTESQEGPCMAIREGWRERWRARAGWCDSWATGIGRDGWGAGAVRVLPMTACSVLAAPGFFAGWEPATAALLIGPLAACLRFGVVHTAAMVCWTTFLALLAWAGHGYSASPPFPLDFLALLTGGGLAVTVAARRAGQSAASTSAPGTTAPSRGRRWAATCTTSPTRRTAQGCSSATCAATTWTRCGSRPVRSGPSATSPTSRPACPTWRGSWTPASARSWAPRTS